MGKKILVLVNLLCMLQNVIAQNCDFGGFGLSFNSQYDIDHFSENYPGCTTINTYVWISGDDITNFNGLSHIKVIRGALNLADLPKIHSLSSLPAFDSIGSIFISRLDSLQTLNGAQFPDYVKDITIWDNPQLSNISSLGNIKFCKTISIEGNTRLTNINGLEGIKELDHLYIQDNPMLIDLTGLINLKKIYNRCYIWNNDALTNLTGMNSVDLIGLCLYIVDNDNLINLTGLDSLVSIGFSFQLSYPSSFDNFLISGNDILVNFEGASSLRRVRGWTTITANQSLNSLKGFNNLSRIDGSIRIINNPSLLNLSDLASLDTIKYELQIHNNLQLSNCASEGICNYLGGWTEISNNAIGCNSIPEVAASCAQSVGKLSVEILPLSAVNAGAKWRLDGGPWQNSATMLNGVFIGQHTVTFNNIVGYLTPSPITVTINSGQLTYKTATYILNSGSIQTNILPQEAINAGAKWKIDNGPLRSSGQVVNNVPLGSHIISFTTVADFVKPDDMSVLVNSNQLTTANGKYQNVDELIPQITISETELESGEILIISGKGFTPNDQVILSFLPPGSNFIETTSSNSEGKFVFTFTIPDASLGVWELKGIDPVAGKNTQAKLFLVTKPVQSEKFLVIRSPTSGDSYFQGNNIHVEFADKLQRNYGNIYYPMDGAYRHYKYRIEYQFGNAQTWLTGGTVEGDDLIGKLITKSFVLKAVETSPVCKVRIIDEFAPSIIATSPSFSIWQNNANIKVEAFWDYSFPKPNIPPQGVAADGVARIYIKVSKLDSSLSVNIQSVEVKLSGNGFTSSNLLGKVKKANNTNTYTEEANDASAIAAASSQPDANGAFWFWYVAPDDFFNTTTGPFNDKSERIVKLLAIAQFQNSTIEAKDFPIKVIRPPLVLVHGLASSPEAFNHFKYSNGTIQIPFIQSPLYKHKKAVKLLPDASFIINARSILEPSISSNSKNTLRGNINELRDLGFACNQVDYVCHSMGGCVMRTAITRFPELYSGANLMTEKTYGKGLIHKAITINTPHNNSPLADLIAEYIPKLSPIANNLLNLWYSYHPNESIPFAFIHPDYSMGHIAWEASPAVKDLQVKDGSDGGVNLAETPVKNHLIAGDIDLFSPSTAYLLMNLDQYLDFTDQILTTAIDFTTDVTLKSYLLGLLTLNKSARVFTFLEWYSAQKGYPNFLGEGDAIVPLKSQLAGTNTLQSNHSIFLISSGLNSNHLDIVDRIEVGDKVKDLLNMEIGSNQFANSIPATSFNNSFYFQPLAASNSSNILSIFDTVKVIIDAPSSNGLIVVDSLVVLKFRVKDLDSINYAIVTFQQQSKIITLLNASNELTFIADPAMLGAQTIYVDISYNTDFGTIHYIDTVLVNFVTTEQVKGFTLQPKISSLFINELLRPNYYSIYNSYISRVPINSPDLHIEVHDSTIVSYNFSKYAFIGKTIGSTSAIVEYFGYSDTLYIEVLSDSLLTSLTSEVNMEPLTVDLEGKIRIFPNPAFDHFYVQSLFSEPVNIQILLFDFTGELVYENNVFNDFSQYETFEVKLENVPSGVYFLRLNSNQITKAFKLIISKG